MKFEIRKMADGWPYVLAGIVLVVGAALRFYQLDEKSIWSDELYSLAWTYRDIPLTKVLDPYSVSTHPPLYFLILYSYFSILPVDVFLGRALSAAFGVGSLLAVFMAGKRLGDYRLGLVAAGLLAVHNMHFFYSQELRNYSLSMLGSSLVIWAMIVWSKEPSKRNGLALGLALSLLSFCHFFGFFGALIFLGLLCIKQMATKPRQPNYLSYVVAAYIFTIWPMAPYVWWNITVESQNFWISSFTVVDALRVVKDLSGGKFGFIALATILMFNGRRSWRNSAIQQLFGFFAVYVGFIVAMSIVNTNVFIPRYFVFLVPIIIFSAAYIVESGSHKKVMLPMIMLALAWPTWLDKPNAFDRRGHGHNIKYAVEFTERNGPEYAILQSSTYINEKVRNILYRKQIPQLIRSEEIRLGDIGWVIQGHAARPVDQRLGVRSVTIIDEWRSNNGRDVASLVRVDEL